MTQNWIQAQRVEERLAHCRRGLLWVTIAIWDFVKGHEELYNKTDNHFKDKAREECLWERFANSYNLSVKV